MADISRPTPPPLPDVALNPADGPLPEARDTEYHEQVLRIPVAGFETYLDSLISRAINLGVPVSRSPSTTALSAGDKRHTSGAESSITLDTSHARTASTGSHASASTTLTSHSSHDDEDEDAAAASITTRKRSRSLSFSQYESYVAQSRSKPKQLAFLANPPPGSTDEHAQSIFSVSTRKSYVSIKNGLSKMRRKRKSTPSPEMTFICCTACREDPQPGQQLVKLPCGHSYCARCLRTMITQALSDESKMPPRCCTQPMPTPTVKAVLSREQQTKFLKSVLQFSTPCDARVFCSNVDCGEFIPPQPKIDPKRPFQAVCRKCQTEVCVLCKREAHPLGKDCPSDTDPDAALTTGVKGGSKRCYKCRTMVDVSPDCTHVTCRCKAQFCHICSAVWNPEVGCPNLCNGEEEMERRRLEEEARNAAREAEEAVKREDAAKQDTEKREAESRSMQCEELRILRQEQLNEMDRFLTFERKSRWLMWTRHAQQKLAIVEKQDNATEKVKERHEKTSINLEDRQVAAEMELRTNLEQSEKNVRIRLKHMEAYCDGLGQNPNSGMPSRTVTERDLRELGQQYNVEKNMRQLHQSKINVMRDRQSKALEDLMERQEVEMSKLKKKHAKEIESLESDFTDQEEVLSAIFSQRRGKLEQRWSLCMTIMCKELEAERKQSLAPLPLPEWPLEPEVAEEGLETVHE